MIYKETPMWKQLIIFIAFYMVIFGVFLLARGYPPFEPFVPLLIIYVLAPFLIQKVIAWMRREKPPKRRKLD